MSGWLAELEAGVLQTLRSRGSATGWQLGRVDPRLRAAIVPRIAFDVPQTVTSYLVAQLGAEGRIVRGAPEGDWTSRRHRSEPVDVLWPQGLPRLDDDAARSELARRWLTAFGPAPITDLQWWTGWSLRTPAGR